MNTSIVIDKETRDKLDNYGEKRALSRSAAIRLIVNEFFLNKEGKA